MKKTLSILLALSLLLACFASCTKQDEVPDDSSADVSAATSDESSEDPVITEITNETIVSIGKPYTTSYEPGESYPDTYGTELCDGIYAAGVTTFTDARLSGWTYANSGTLSVTFDMGEDSQRLYKFGVSYYSTRTAGLGPLGSARVFMSDDGKNWSHTPKFDVPEYVEDTMQQAWVTLDTPVNARFVRFDLDGTSAWLFLDELIIIADVSGSAFHTQYLEQLDAAYSGNHLSASDLKAGSSNVSRELTSINAALGRTYTTSRKASASFPDEANLLTDGAETGVSYENGAYVGFDGGEALTIDVAFGKTVENLSDFTISMYQQAGLRQMLPYYVDFYISEDGKTYERIGRAYAPDDLSITNFTFGLHLAKGFSAKAVRFELAETNSNLFLIEEVTACYYGVSASKPLYPALELPEVTETRYWPNPSSQVTNLAAGLPYQITSGAELEYADEIDANTPASAGVLTDGKYSPNLSFDNGYWNRTRNGGMRSVYLDLGYNSSITGFKINYLYYKPYAITAPPVTYLYLSEDGVSWYSAGFAVCTPATDTETVAAEATLEAPVEARFVRINFSVSPHTYADEIEIYGTQAITGGTRKLSDLPGTHPSVTNQYMAPGAEILEGVSDMALLYSTSVTWDEELILPYIAYLDKEGNIKDTMFDGLLFMPARDIPSEENPTPLDQWLHQVDKDFQEGINFDAAEKVTKRVKETLGLPSDYKVKVYVTILYPERTETNFGDIDGDGVSEDFSKLEDRVKAISCIMDLYLTRFAEAKYENLTFGGFYWFWEEIKYQDDANDTMLLSAVAKEAEAKGSQLFWIPYYRANGYMNWNAFGFSAVCMQPNYVFNQATPVSQIYTAVDYIKKLGIGIELELENSSLTQTEFYKRYMKYLGYGIEAGYMKDCIHMYYQGHDVYYNACYSEGEMGRNVYEATYGFIKGTLTGPEQLKDFSISCETGKYTQGNLLKELEGLHTAELLLSAEHGSVTVDEKGGYLYIPYEGFTGTDTFTFRYSNYLTWSEATTVTVTVG